MDVHAVARLDDFAPVDAVGVGDPKRISGGRSGPNDKYAIHFPSGEMAGPISFAGPLVRRTTRENYGGALVGPDSVRIIQPSALMAISATTDVIATIDHGNRLRRDVDSTTAVSVGLEPSV